ncbi:peptidase family M49-domain-containing protein [Immersiella caudata]|uniref:Peptidase family M49-domain-containing protein n=1 Tax=Immersiella caudata TaxID=314043 RepID=A0AA40C2H8_9PEZI|nr:peptidase family M49-domain-containing protein [Immersiella caudata]
MSPPRSSHAPPPGAIVHQLEIKPIFDTPKQNEKLYAHHMAQAAWHGSRIVMRQVSAEGPDIFDFIMKLHSACGGDWDTLITQCDTLPEQTRRLLGFIPSSIPTAFTVLDFQQGEGNQKFCSRSDTRNSPEIAAISPEVKSIRANIADSLVAVPSYRYYPGTETISPEEIANMSEVMETRSIGPENTRIRKLVENRRPIFHLLQASAEPVSSKDTSTELASGIFLIRATTPEELSKVCLALKNARKYAANNNQIQFLTHYVECFRTSSLEAFQESQKAWVKDVAARVESLIGFIEPCRDPAGISLFEAPDFTSVHALAVCGSIVSEAANLPNAKRCSHEPPYRQPQPRSPCHWVNPSELKRFKNSTQIVRFPTTATHELLGHGTGKLLSETEPGTYNFDKQNPPISPLTQKPVTSHYLPGQTWNGVFGKLAGTVEECRAILVSEYLMENKELLEMFGYTDDSDITADDPLEHYNSQNHAWGQFHHQAHFSVLKHLLQDGGGVIRISHDAANSTLTVHVDPSKLASHGKPWEFYEPLCAVEGEYEEWRKIVCSKPKPRWKFVQPNTFVRGDEGIIQSWAERNI